MKSFLKYWLPVCVWLGVIFIGSSDMMSAEHTSRIIGPFLRWLRPEISQEAIETVQFFIRKGAHLTEYALFAMLLWRAFYRGTALAWRLSILFLCAWVGATIVGAADEYHQSFVPSRGSSPKDVMIDSAGAIIGLLVCSRRWRRTRRDSSDSSGR